MTGALVVASLGAVAILFAIIALASFDNDTAAFVFSGASVATLCLTLLASVLTYFGG
jgi:hypothetical protein